MDGLICMVTGATSGIGKAVAVSIAKRGDILLLIGRDKLKTEAVLEEIKKLSGNEKISYMLADLSSQEEIRKLVPEIYEKYPRLEILINNAGSVFMSRADSVDGIEMTFALNHLSYFLISNLLLPLICRSYYGRIINVSSSAHERSHINFSDPQFKKNYNVVRAYGRSKLANLLFSYQLAKRVDGTNVTVNAVHPGVVATNLVSSNNRSVIAKFLTFVLKYRGIDPQVSANHIMDMFTSREFFEVNGKYFVDGRIVPSAPQSYIQSDAENLWDLSNCLTNSNFPKT